MKIHGNLRFFQRLFALGTIGISTMPLFIVPSGEVLVPEQWKLNPPGDCTPERHRELQTAVRTECDKRGKMQCLKPDDCLTIQGKIFLFEKCISARTKINDECFRGGDAEHHEQIRQRRKGLDECKKLLTKKQLEKECTIKLCPSPK